MPDPFLHEHFGSEVNRSLPKNIQSKIDAGVFSRALQGPDPWSTIGFFGGKYKCYANRSSVMHKQKTGEFLLSCAKESKDTQNVYMFSYLCGFICHYCLDRHTHPYIIAKSGEYDGTEDTYKYRGNHTRIERALDCIYIRTAYNKTPWRVCIPKMTYRLKKYPVVMKESLDRIYKSVYGWNDGFDLTNVSLRYDALFYSMMQDPLGILHYALRPISHKGTNYCIFSYYKRDNDSSVVDYANEKHEAWTHPYDTSIISHESFYDLYEVALDNALKMINATYRYVFLDDRVCLSEVLGHESYCTGFDYKDPRHSNVPVYSPINYPNRYF